jgi:flagellar hook assembly protein FlgD
MQIRTVLAGLGVVAATLSCGALLAPSASAATVHTSAAATLSASTAGFSPNGDGKQDKITFSYELPESGVTALEFLNSKGAVIGQKTISDGTALLGLDGLTGLSAGSGTYTWDGTLDAGLPISGNQDIKARLVSLDSNSLTDCLTGNGGLLGNLDLGNLDLGNLDLSNLDLSDLTQCSDSSESPAVPIEVVTNAPALSLKTSLGTVFPVKDGYRDSMKLSAKAVKAAATSFTLSKPNGDVLRKWTGSDSGFSTSWNGTDSAGKSLKAGFYKLTGVAAGEYGNKATTKTVAVRVSSKQFEMNNGEWTLVTQRP